MMRRLLVLALGAMLIAAAPAAAKRPPHALKAIWGPNETHGGKSAFPIYRALGVNVLQEQLLWSRVAVTRPIKPRDPDDPAYRWPKNIDQAVAGARANRFRVAIMVRTSPSWANGGSGPDTRPSDPRDYADFLVAAAVRYKRVKHWMIWGEPSRGPLYLPFNPDSPDAAQNYARLLDRSYAALKSVRRSIKVIGGMTWSGGLINPPQWLAWMKLPNGKPPRLDWFGHNPFTGRRPRLSDRPYYKGVRDMSDVDTLRREIARAYRPRRIKPRLWLSEFTVGSDHPNMAFSFFVSRAEQARWLSSAFRIAYTHRYIAGIGWWQLEDETTPDGTTSGLLDKKGNRKPSYFAFKRAR